MGEGCQISQATMDSLGQVPTAPDVMMDPVQGLHHLAAANGGGEVVTGGEGVMIDAAAGTVAKTEKVEDFEREQNGAEEDEDDMALAGIGPGDGGNGVPATDDGSVVFRDGDGGSDDFEWSRDTAFRCHACGLSIDGFSASVSHMTEEHYHLSDGDRCAICVLCGKAFGRRDHLKNHVWSHVNKVRTGGCPRRLADANKFKGQGPSFLTFTCKLCPGDLAIEGLKAYCDHVGLIHPQIPQFQCPTCEKEFANFRLLRCHYILHTELKKGCPVSHEIAIF